MPDAVASAPVVCLVSGLSDVAGESWLSVCVAWVCATETALFRGLKFPALVRNSVFCWLEAFMVATKPALQFAVPPLLLKKKRGLED